MRGDLAIRVEQDNLAREVGRYCQLRLIRRECQAARAVAGHRNALEEVAVVERRQVVTHVGPQVGIRGEQHMQIAEVQLADFMHAGESGPQRLAIW